MIKQIRTSKFTRFVAFYLAIMLFAEMIQPMRTYALTGGPSQPEFESFTPISTSDMVDLSSGDFNYNIPIMDVGGYPLNLAYSSGVSMDQEASWVGLGWDLNVGQITRQVRGLPDDFEGDQMVYENNMRPNTTIGSNFNVFLAPFGFGEKADLSGSVGVGVKYNNYDGLGFSLNGGLSYQIGDNLSVGMNLESSSTDGVTASPNVSLHGKIKDKEGALNSVGLNAGVSMNSRKGIESMTMSGSRTKTMRATQNGSRNDKGEVESYGDHGKSSSGSIGGGSISYVDANFTPSKRVGMSSSNFMFNLNVEGAVYGVDPGLKFSGYCNTQGIKSSEKFKIEKAYGYQNTYKAGASDILDFNREKDRTVNRNTVSLPVTNYTYDLYSAQGQGVGGMFRAYRGQVGYVYDNYVHDDSFGANLGIEFGAGAGTHWGIDLTVTDSDSSTGLWESNNTALNRAKEKKTGNKPNYESVFFKNIGGTHVDKDMEALFYSSENNNSKLGGYGPISFKIGGGNFSRGTELAYYDKLLENALPVGSSSSINRSKYRLNRNQIIQKLSVEESTKYGSATFSPYIDRKAQRHHTAEIRIIKPGGEQYTYGRAAYNIVKKEVTFDVSRKGQRWPSAEDCKKGLISYNPGHDNSANNSKDGDQMFNRITTPAYAHSYLLTSVLSSDYQDIDNKKGPSDGDLGTYTKFSYVNKNAKVPYRWRIPFDKNRASFDEGLKSLEKDNKASYQYGEKELLYINKIETKTHVAIFHISERKDGYGVVDENGGIDRSETSKMWKLDKISLYSKPEYEAHKDNLEEATPIKEAHFKYDYSLCQGIDNNVNKGNAEFIGQQGKLTLKKVYFTYQNSKMGKYTPYLFDYDAENEESNPAYDMKGYDLWGNFKKSAEHAGCRNQDELSNAEYGYVDQSSKAKADKYASAWLLRSIKLPSGGEMNLSYESDDYKYVQDRDVMQMFKVTGTGNSPDPSDPEQTDKLFDEDCNYLYIRLDNHCQNNTDFYNKYLKKLIGKPIYFRFLLNMTKPNLSDKYDYVAGYLNLDIQNSGNYGIFQRNGLQYAAIKVQREGDINPITKAGWYFGQNYLNNLVYSLTGDEGLDVNNIEGVVKSLIDLVPNVVNIFRNPNAELKDKKIASKFMKDKAWIRLMCPSEVGKFGGGSRVKEIKIMDNWDVMTDNTGNGVYAQSYGQQYSYTAEDGTSSGVATYEPLGSKENPFIEPFYDHSRPQSLLGPDVKNYVELPFGECFFPSPKVTYGRVTVKNLPREKRDGDEVIATVKKHATGSVVSEFFTSKDYPTLSDYTLISSKYDNSDLASILNINVKTHLTMSQGFSIHTNDMDGKAKAQWVYAEGQTEAISGVEYKYDQLEENDPHKGKLDNKITTIDAQGNIKENIVGVDYDVINDFRQNSSDTTTAGIHFNTAGLPLFMVFLIVPSPIPSYSHHENMLRTAVTTKTIHSSGILRETIAYDAGSKVSTKNLAWDADTGEVLLTETVNEYNDKYYNFNMPAYWAYKGMSQGALNLGLEHDIETASGVNKFRLKDNHSESDYLIDGDEIWITSQVDPVNKRGFKAWVVNVTGSDFKLIDDKGVLINNSDLVSGHFKVVKSGYRNLQMSNMASVTLMKNPLTWINPDGLEMPKNHIYPDDIALTDYGNPFLTNDNEQDWKKYRIVNASAIEYKEEWPSQCECGLPKMVFGADKKLKFEFNNNSTDEPEVIERRSYNPYRYNILGNWRAVKSYAYLTGRNTTTNPTPRKTGFFKDFKPFYRFNSNSKKWEIAAGTNYERWTFASEVTQYNPFGQEVENKDALKRYSSALYGYNNRFAVAVASNSQYKELAFDGFEDYNLATCALKTHFNFLETLSNNSVSISDKEAHTGRKSIRLEPKKKAVIAKKIVPCESPANQTKTISNKPKVKQAKAVKKQL